MNPRLSELRMEWINEQVQNSQYTHEEFAAKASISSKTLQRFLNGNVREIRKNTLEKIARAIGPTYEQMFKRYLTDREGDHRLIDTGDDRFVFKTGAEGLHWLLREATQVLPPKSQKMISNCPENGFFLWLGPESFNMYMREFERRGVEGLILLSDPNDILPDRSSRYAHIPGKVAAPKVTHYIYHDCVAWIDWEDVPEIYRIKNPNIAAAEAEKFNKLWSSPEKLWIRSHTLN